MRRLQGARRDGPDERGHGPVACGRIRPVRAILHRAAVGSEGRQRGVERVVEQHHPPAHLRTARAQLREVANDDHRCGDPLRRRPDAAAQAEHPERRPPRAHELRRLHAAHPVGHAHGLPTNVLEPVALHLVDDPVERAFQTLRPAHAVAETIGEGAESPVGGAVAERGVDQPVGGGAVSGGGRLLRERAIGRERQCREREEQSGLDAHAATVREMHSMARPPSCIRDARQAAIDVR